MKARTIIIASGVVWGLGAAAKENGTLFAVVIFAHIALWMLHRIETRINRLSAHLNVRVTERDLAE